MTMILLIRVIQNSWTQMEIGKWKEKVLVTARAPFDPEQNKIHSLYQHEYSSNGKGLPFHQFQSRINQTKTNTFDTT
jgi:hypothetical protein